MLSLSGHPIYRRTLKLLNESSVRPRDTPSRCHLGTLRTKKDWQCLGGPVGFNQGGLIYLCSSATRLFMVLMALTVMIFLNLIVMVKQDQTIHLI